MLIEILFLNFKQICARGCCIFWILVYLMRNTIQQRLNNLWKLQPTTICVLCSRQKIGWQSECWHLRWMLHMWSHGVTKRHGRWNSQRADGTNVYNLCISYRRCCWCLGTALPTCLSRLLVAWSSEMWWLQVLPPLQKALHPHHLQTDHR